jgi:hypothetical protein
MESSTRSQNPPGARVRVLDRILTRLLDREDVWWARKDQTAQWTLDLWVPKTYATRRYS